MGGFLSSRWHNHRKKTTVESCFVITSNNWWPNTRLGLRTSDFRHGLEGIDEDSLYLRLRYNVKIKGGEKEQLQLVPLQTTRPHFGGKRTWFTCPTWKESKICGRRVLKLYRPPYARYFGCRQCHNLTYQSAQEHDSRVTSYLNNPDDFLAALENEKPSAAQIKAAASLLKGVL